MSTKSMFYDNASYLTRQSSNHTSVAGSGTVGARHTAITGELAYSAVLSVLTAGTSAATNLAIIQKVSGTATTALATVTLGTATANTVFYTTLTNVAGGVSLIQGDKLQAVNGTDIVGVFSIAYEYSIAPLANVTV
jgi:hypothetical protein